MKEIERLHKTVLHSFEARGEGAFRVGRNWYLHAGLETRTERDYAWDGLKRGVDPQHPYLIWQYGFEGEGFYEDVNGRVALTPGMAFTSIVPSAHCYGLPPHSPSWTFFWITFHHDYVVQRLQSCVEANGGVLRAEPTSRLVANAVSLFDIWTRGRSDAWEEENALFGFMIELERFWQSKSYGASERERWLHEVRRSVLKNLHRVIDVDELASQNGMSRSYYTHRFKAATGRSPARWMMQVRLEEATRRLLHTDQKLDAIARATGLQNANHLCKVFRRHFHLSPGEFRRQMK